MRKKLLFVGGGAAAAIAVASLAWAAIPSGDGTISACYSKATGALRVVDAEAGASCLAHELPLRWTQNGTEVVGARTIRTTQTPAGNVPITARVSGPFGFPAEGEAMTPVVTLTLAPGRYLLNTRVGLEKTSGLGDVVCFVRSTAQLVTAYLRVTLGTDAGGTRRTMTGSDGFFDTATAGTRATLECAQVADGAEPTGTDAIAFYATITATTVSRFGTTADGN